MGTVNEPIQDGIGQGWFLHPGMPAGDWQLTGHEGGAGLHAVVQQFQQVVALGRQCLRTDDHLGLKNRTKGPQAFGTAPHRGTGATARQFFCRRTSNCVKSLICKTFGHLLDNTAETEEGGPRAAFFMLGRGQCCSLTGQPSADQPAPGRLHGPARTARPGAHSPRSC
jgi:hypothetical protein